MSENDICTKTIDQRTAQVKTLSQITLTLEQRENYQILTVKLNQPSITFEQVARKNLRLQGLKFEPKPVVVSGKMPLWLAACLTHRIHTNCPAILIYVPQTKNAVVIAAHSPQFVEGMVLPISEDLTIWD